MIAVAIAASSALSMVLVIPAPFGSTKLELPSWGHPSGVVDPCPNKCFTFLDMAATIREGPGFPVGNFSVSPGLD